MADFGFGTYRISDTNQAHLDALSEAIRGGIKLIDTSTNYFNGGAERAIGKVLSKFDESVKDEIQIVSKFGYIQGDLLSEYTQENSDLKALICDVVEYSPECFHCIDQEFVSHQLSCSLERLQCDKIDCYLVHNPEYYILDAINKGIKKETYTKEMQNRLFESFVALEKEVQNGRINGYGVSSNSFAKPKNDPEFLEYENLLDLAHEAALAAGNETHSFTTIELPINIIEKQGLHVTFWAKENNLRVLSNRPLNAVYNGKMYRLSEYDESRDYYMYLNELLEFCDNELLRPVYNLINQLDESIHKFEFVGDYDTFIHTQVLPHLQRSLQDIDGDTREKLIAYLDLFLSEYRQMVEYESGRRTKEELKRFFKNCNEPIQNCALKYLLEQESIDYVLVGARRVRYVYDLLALRDELV
ncbi:MAG: aldo/keto reductase [Epsilonproteobacteria bacterium]|nr:aldo/keto reductase [Campylobacterota bacterium]